MRQKIVSRKEFAGFAGRNPSTITRLCNGTLSDACVGKRIDLNHSVAIKYLKERGKEVPSFEKDLTKRFSENIREFPEDISKVSDMTLRELIQKFGTEAAFSDWLKASKMIEEIHEKRIKSAHRRGELVNRDLVKKGIIDPIEAAHLQLLSDGARTMAQRAVALHDSGRPITDIEMLIVEQISSFIRPLKAVIRRTLKNFESDYG